MQNKDDNPLPLGGYSMGILEEYQLKVEEQKKDLLCAIHGM